MGLISSADLIFTHNNILYKELKFQDYRNLLKCFLGDKIDPAFIIPNTTNVLTQCTFLSKKEIIQLTYIDYMLLLFQIRINSLGSGVFLVTNYNEKEAKINLDLIQVVDNLKINFANISYKAVDDLGEYFFKLPTIDELFKIENKKYNSIIYFIDKIILKNNTILFKDYSDLEKNTILQKLPLKSLATINKFLKKINTNINKTNFLEPINNSTFQISLPLLPNINDISFIIKLIFNNDLNYIYETIFVLSKYANMSSVFLDNCTPGEFFYFSKKFEELNIQASKKQNTGTDNLPPVNPDSFFEME
jgi:hypothetical protein